jgi:hypothetical protein
MLFNTHNEILNEIDVNGIFLSYKLLNESEIEKLKNEFNFTENNKIINISELEELKSLSYTLYNFVKKPNISKFLESYLKDTPVCTSVHFTRSKMVKSINEKDEIDKGSVLGFHNDDKGKQIKINFLLNNLEKDTNGLDYALKSHKLSLIDNLILLILQKFNLMKGWDKHFLNYFNNKIRKKKVNFLLSSKVFNKYKIKHVYGKKGLVYIFDTNGYHRQSYSTQKNPTYPRELLTLYFIGKKKLYLIKKKL